MSQSVSPQMSTYPLALLVIGRRAVKGFLATLLGEIFQEEDPIPVSG